MPRAERPAAPIDDLKARRKWAGRVLASGLLTEELASFCQSGVSVIVGSRSLDGRPVAGIALACVIEQSGKVRLLLRAPANTELLHAVENGAGIAATFSEPRTHRSIQLKGLQAHRVPVPPEDYATVARQCRIFRDQLELVGYSASFAALYCTYREEEIVAVEFYPEQAFVQTPGPGAGSELT